MKFIYSDHANENIIERKIAKDLVEDTVNSPDLVIDSNKGRKIAQKNIGNRLLRVIYKETAKVYIIVTAYFTSIGRYQNGS